jgi:hypothetical protein
MKRRVTEGERSEGRATTHSVDPQRAGVPALAGSPKNHRLKATHQRNNKGPGAIALGRFLGVIFMPMRTFMIPVTDGGEACDALNQFMRHVRVLSTERRFVELGLQSFWSILVDYLEVKPESVSAEQRPTKFRNRIDYREVLDPDAFSLFAQLREFRKRLSQEEGVPIYTIFTNEQLAEIAKNRIVTKSGLEKVDGIGGARLSRYGDAVLRFLESQLGTSHEESSKPL